MATVLESNTGKAIVEDAAIKKGFLYKTLHELDRQVTSTTGTNQSSLRNM